MHYADHATKEWDNTIQLTHYLVNWKKKNMEPNQRHTDKMTWTWKKKKKPHKQMKTIRGTAVTEMKKKMPHDSHCQLKRPHGLEHKTLNYKKHGPKIKIKIAWTK